MGKGITVGLDCVSACNFDPLKLGTLVGEIVRQLDNEDLEYHHRIEWRSPALRSIRVGERRIQFGAEYLEINRGPECFELIAEIAQSLQPIIDVEKSPLASHRLSSNS
jgi:hypothetical protein